MTNGRLPRERTPVVRLEFEQDGSASPATAIVEAVAAAEGVDPVELDVLYERIDAEGLNQLLTASETVSPPTVSVQFAAAGRIVCACNDGTIGVYDEDQFAGCTMPFGMPSAE